MEKENIPNHQTTSADNVLMSIWNKSTDSGNTSKNKLLLPPLQFQPARHTISSSSASINTNDSDDSSVDTSSNVSDLRLQNLSRSGDGSDQHLEQQSYKSTGGIPLRNDPIYGDYFKMIARKIRRQWINKLLEERNLDKSILDLDPNRSLESQVGTRNEIPDEAVASLNEGDEDEADAKYFKTLKLGTNGEVQMSDPSIPDLDPEKSIPINKEELDDKGPPLNEDPKYMKFFTMLNMGVPMGAVKNALTREGYDPSIMDLDPAKSVEYQQAVEGMSKEKNPLHNKSKVRRKKIFWNPIEEPKTSDNSVWSMVKGAYDFESLNVDQDEFKSLFTDTSNISDKKKVVMERPKKSKQKKSVQAIGDKRGMNGDIILAQFKMEIINLAGMVNVMECGKLDDTQLKALHALLPTEDEKFAIDRYIKGASSSEKAKEAAINDFCACEKYMLAMMEVDMADKKLEAMLFKYTFDAKVKELMTDASILRSACQEVQQSARLRKLMGMILTVGNQINTGGGQAKPHGFTLDALPKLNEAKAFDKKTTILQYLVKLVKANEPDILNIREGIPSVSQAESISLNGLLNGFEELNEQLSNVKETSSAEVKPIRDGKTDVKQAGGSGLESFAKNAETRSKEAQVLIEDTQKTFEEVLAYFRADLTMDSIAFFGTWNKFLTEFQSALEIVEKAAILKDKRAKGNSSSKRQSFCIT